jgi:O-methyltransferase involved in polyketide biosynthesis
MARDDAWLRQAGRADRSGDDAGAAKLDTKVAYSARVNNYWRGGKDNFAADREAAEQAVKAFPALPEAVRAGQAFRQRVARYLAAETAVRQFLDLGTGLPTGETIYQIAESLAPGGRVVYTDNDPMVLSHARALLTDGVPGSCAYVEADLRDTGTLLAAAAQTLDLTEPVAVILVSVLHLVLDTDDPYAIVSRLMQATAPGSHLVIVHPSSDIRPEASAQMAANLNRMVAQKRTYRSHGEVSRFFGGLDLVEPGVVPLPQWRPDTADEAAVPTLAWSGVARKSR